MAIFIRRCLPALILLAAVSCLILSLVSFEWIAAWILASPQGSSRASFASRFSGIQLGLRLLGCTLTVLAVAAHLARHKISSWFDRTLVPLPRFVFSAFADFSVEMWRSRPLDFWTLSGIFLIGLALRIHFLFEPIQFDEADTYMSYASRPLLVGMSWYPMPNNHILHTVALHFVSMIFGGSEWAIRIPAFLAGIALIPVTYVTGKQLFDSRTGLVAASLVACHSSMVSYSANGRGYSMVCVFTCLLWITARSLLIESSESKWFILSALMALGFYTIPIFLYPTAAVLVWLAISSITLSPTPRRNFQLNLAIAALLGGILTIVLYIPVLLTVGYKNLVLNSYVAPRTFAQVFSELPNGIRAFGSMLVGDFPFSIALLAAAGLLVGLVYRWTGNGFLFSPLMAAAMTILPIVILQRVMPFTRVWTFLVPQIAIFSGSGLALFSSWFKISPKPFAVGVLSFTLTLSFFTWNGSILSARPQKQDPENIALWLKRTLQPSDVVATELEAGFPLAYYLARNQVQWKRSPAKCDPMLMHFSSQGDQTKNGRIFAVSTIGKGTLKRVFASICVDLSLTEKPERVYKGHRFEIHLLKARPDPNVSKTQ